MVEDIDVIKRIVETGEVSFGTKSVTKLLSTKKPKLVILSINCPSEIRQELTHYAKLATVPVYDYKGTSLELGEVCRKPFPISAMAVMNPGTASIVDLVKK